MNRRSIARNVQKGFTLIELMIVVAIIGILAAIAIPQYQNYVAKSQVSRVMAETGALKTAVETCLLDGKDDTTTPPCELGWTESNLLGGTVNLTKGPAVTMDRSANTASIVATFQGNAAAALQKTGENTLTWTRLETGAWSCSTTVQQKYRPAGCSSSTAATGGGDDGDE